jgi:Carboxypeptidase regulatory-like domain
MTIGNRRGAMRALLFPLLVAPTIVWGQTPSAAPPAGSLSGVVRDVGGAPIADVNVTLVGESAAARTDSVGHFSLRDVTVGNHTALFRRIGYRSVEYRWTARFGGELQVAVAMTPVPRQLDRVVVEAPTTSRRRGTSSIEGIVSDSTGRPVDGADIRLLGGGLATVTDSTGKFEFAMLAAGSYIVRARRQGLMSGNYVMQVADDDDRGITLKLYGLPKKTGVRDTAAASGYGVSDAGFDAYDRRERSGSGNPTLGPGDLFRANGAGLDFVLQQYRDAASLPRRRSAIADVGPGSTDEGDCLLIDGRRAVYQPLRSFSSREVQMVEVIRPNGFADPFVISEMESLRECRGSMDHHPSYFVLWTRSLR